MSHPTLTHESENYRMTKAEIEDRSCIRCRYAEPVVVVFAEIEKAGPVIRPRPTLHCNNRNAQLTTMRAILSKKEFDNTVTQSEEYPFPVNLVCYHCKGRFFVPEVEP